MAGWGSLQPFSSIGKSLEMYLWYARAGCIPTYCSNSNMLLVKRKYINTSIDSIIIKKYKFCLRNFIFDKNNSSIKTLNDSQMIWITKKCVVYCKMLFWRKPDFNGTFLNVLNDDWKLKKSYSSANLRNNKHDM